MSRPIPDHWVTSLFKKMGAIYGARFTDLWRDVDLSEVRKTWAEGLGSISHDNLRRGVAALYRTKYPPTLPEFIELCAPQVPMYRPPSLSDVTNRTPPPEARIKLAGLAASIVRTQGTGIEWARRILAEAETRHLPAMKIAIAEEAVRKFNLYNPPPEPAPEREREPCDDDEAEPVEAQTAASTS